MDKRKEYRQYFFMGLALALVGFFVPVTGEPDTLWVVGTLMRGAGGFITGFYLRRAWF